MHPSFRHGIAALALATLLLGCPSPLQTGAGEVVASGAISRVAGGFAPPWAPQSKFFAINDIAIDARSTLYVLDHTEVRKVGLDGSVTTHFTPDGEVVVFPQRMALGPKGELYLADADAHAIFAIEADGEARRIVKSEDGSFTDPTSITAPLRLRADSEGRLFMLDWDGNSASVIEVSPQGFSSSLFEPGGKHRLGEVEIPEDAAIEGLEVTRDDTVILVDEQANVYTRDKAGAGKTYPLAMPKPIGPPGEHEERHGVTYRLDHKDRLVALRSRYETYETLLIGQFFSSAEVGPAYKYLGFEVIVFDAKGRVAKHQFVKDLLRYGAAAFDANGHLYLNSDQELHVIRL